MYRKSCTKDPAHRRAMHHPDVIERSNKILIYPFPGDTSPIAPAPADAIDDRARPRRDDDLRDPERGRCGGMVCAG